MNQDFKIYIKAVSGDVTTDLPLMSKAATGWLDEGGEDEDEDDDNFLLTGEDSDDTEADNESDDEDDPDDEGPDEGEVGRLTLQLAMSASVFDEYRNLRDSDDEHALVVTIVYYADQVPVYHHEYTLPSGMYLVQTEGAKRAEPLVLELTGVYEDCIQFATFSEPASTTH